MSRYLIVKTSALGDILQALPVLTYIRACDSEAYVGWVVEERCRPLLDVHPLVDAVYVLGQKIEPYDVLFDLQGNCKSALQVLKCRAKYKMGFGFGYAAEWPNRLALKRGVPVDSTRPIWQQLMQIPAAFFDRPVLSEIPQQLLSGQAASLPIETLMVCPGSRWENKTLGVSQWCTLLETIAETHNPHFLFVAEKEAPWFSMFPQATVILTPSFGDWQQLMVRSTGVLAVDSCALHLAALAHVPTFSFFGPTRPYFYALQSVEDAHVWGQCPYGTVFLKRCSHLRSCPTGACLKTLPVAALLPKFSVWWGRVKGRNRCALRRGASLPGP